MFGTNNQPYQPTQLYHVAQDGFTCELMPPDEALQAAIYYYWKMTIEAEKISLPIIPDGAFDLVLSPQIPNFAVLFPPKNEPFEIPLQGPIVYAGVSFRTEKTRQFFPMPLGELDALEGGSDVVEVLNLGALVGTIQDEFDSAELAAAFDGFFSGYQPPSRDLFGLAPKQIHRILRLQAALGELLHPQKPFQLTDYYDDLHKIRELKARTGLTPGEIRRMAEKYNKRVAR